MKIESLRIQTDGKILWCVARKIRKPFRTTKYAIKSVAIVQSGEFKRHYETTREDFRTKISPGSAVR